MWDATNLYFLATVSDSALVNGSPDWNGDAIEVYIDGDNNKSTTYDSNDFQYVLGYGHTAISEYAHSATTNVKFAQVNITGGYQMEFAMPWTTLTVSPSANMQIGLDVGLDDATTSSGGRTAQLFWHDTSGNDYSNPSLFGVGVLQSGTLTVPGAPSSLAGTPGNTQVSLAWSAPTTGGAVATYNVYQGTSAGGESGTPIKTGVTTTSYTDTGLTNGTTYYYKVAGVNSVGTGAMSNEASATPVCPLAG